MKIKQIICGIMLVATFKVHAAEESDNKSKTAKGSLTNQSLQLIEKLKLQLNGPVGKRVLPL